MRTKYRLEKLKGWEKIRRLRCTWDQNGS